MVVCRVVVGLACFVLAAGCQPQSSHAPELRLEPVAAAEVGCALLLDEAELSSPEGRFQAVVKVIDGVRAGRCDPISAEARVCRSLFLIAVSDPLLGIGGGLTDEMVAEIAEEHGWALEEGIAAARASGNDSLAVALTELSALGITDALEAEPDRLAVIAGQRAARSIVELIAEAEATCQMS